ncbi:MAG: hypothetical protein OXH15_05300 [Gammaproteobacteria bacterium]|nr:hypothetical protein [Gammaproteobacteria bacterium]
MLHADNPFGDSADDLANFLTVEAPHWLRQIVLLLNHHHAFPAGTDSMYIVMMQGASDGDVHMTEFVRHDGPPQTETATP